MKCNKITISKNYIVLPVNMNAKRKKICIMDGEGKLIYDFDAHIDFNTPRFYTYINLQRFRGLSVTLSVEPEIDFDFTFADSIPDNGYYNEELRPMVHFSAKIGWINDPNGLVYYNGRYHMFFQHNPAGSSWGNMTWGHAISDDLVRWRELESALYPDELGTMFSGSAITDKENVSGLRDKGIESANDAILLFYTAAGDNSALSRGKKSTQCLAYSTDRGISFKKYGKNPVIGHIVGGNRDPKVIYCREKGCYILALFLDGHEYALFSSENLINWQEFQRISMPCDAECPDIYPLEVQNEAGGKEKNRKWILSGASDTYIVGEFTHGPSGRFVQVQSERPYLHGKHTSYAAQTFSGTAGRRIKVAWDILHAPDSVFENQMGIPAEVSLVRVGSEYRLRTLPVCEFGSLVLETKAYTVNECGTIRAALQKSGYDIEIKAPVSSPAFTVSFFGFEFRVNPAENSLAYDDVTVPLSYTRSGIDIRIISDTLGCELFLDGGLIYTVAGSLADYGIRYLTVQTEADAAVPDIRVNVSELEGIWSKRKREDGK